MQSLLPRGQCSCPKLLIVDDEPMNLYVMKSYIVMINQTADYASNGRQAVDLVLARAQLSCCHKYAAVFMDLNMPIMNGTEAAACILNYVTNGQVQSTPIVALSANRFNEAEQVSMLKYGFTSIVEKPISKATFSKLVNAFLHSP